MGQFKKYITCIMAFFTPFAFVILVSFTLSLPLFYSLKIRNYRTREKKILAYIAAASVYGFLYFKGGIKSHL